MFIKLKLMILTYDLTYYSLGYIESPSVYILLFWRDRYDSRQLQL